VPVFQCRGFTSPANPELVRRGGHEPTATDLCEPGVPTIESNRGVGIDPVVAVVEGNAPRAVCSGCSKPYKEWQGAYG
jgi:hypothetical protein